MLLALYIALICSTNLSFDQVHFKDEQPQVLSRDSHVTQTRFTKRRAQRMWFEYDDTMVGMRLDQRSCTYWDSWKLIGKLWRCQHEIWL